MKFTVRLNGTDRNPFEAFGLKQNPFPQIAEYEYASQILHLQALGGEPIPNTQYIRDHLRGWPDWFVDGLCQRFQLGVMVVIDYEWKQERMEAGGVM